MPDVHIFHYEDEPPMVDFPGLIEVALYHRTDVGGSCIDEEDDSGQNYTIRYVRDGASHVLHYVIDESIEAIEARATAAATDAVLHLVDMSISGDEAAGAKIVEALLGRGVPRERIWMVTAYEAQAKQNPLLADVVIFPKPSPFADMTSRILDILLKAA